MKEEKKETVQQANPRTEERKSIHSIIGLGKFSVRKSYYPELQRMLDELEEEKNKYESIFSGALHGIFQMDLNGRITVTNPALNKMCGYPVTPTSGPIAYEGEQIFAVPDEKEQLMDMLLNNESVVGFETQLWKRDGTTIDVSLSGTYRESSEDEYFEFFVQDITEQRRGEEEKLQRKKFQMIATLAEGIAHNFNDLLTSLFGNIELAKMLLDEEHNSQKHLDASTQALEKANQLTKQLLTFAKGGDPSKEALEIGPIIEEAAETSVLDTKAKLNLNIPSNLWQVEVDKEQLKQVINNLVANSIQAMPLGGEISLNVRNKKETPIPYVEIQIKDEGIGIEEQNLDRIFEPYFSTKSSGGGLGLATTQSIIQKHEGQITVDSIHGGGTTVTVSLPAIEKETEETPTPYTSKKMDAVKGTGRLLVLEDEEAIRKILNVMLTKAGFELAMAVEGQEAVSLYQEELEKGNPFDAVIVDLTIRGGMGGLTAAHGIWELNSDAKVIVSSGYSIDPVLNNYKEYGFIARIAKPYRFAELQKVITEVIDQ